MDRLDESLNWSKVIQKSQSAIQDKHIDVSKIRVNAQGIVLPSYSFGAKKPTTEKKK
ncbi:MAG: hypothetical protein JJT78_16280 [Leptospira sp.]|nr:hypothetical protein [Leptospira sp.]